MMAKIMCEYDTKTKKLSVKKDGEDLSNVHEASFYKQSNYNDDGTEDNGGDTKHRVHITMRNADKEHGTMTHTNLTANDNGDIVTKDEDVIEKEMLSFIGSVLSQSKKN